MILYNLEYYPYYVPEQYLDTNVEITKKDEIVNS